MPTWYIGGGLRFFALSVIAALVLAALAPLGAIRVLGVFAFMCATAGLALHLYAMHVEDPRAFAALRHRLQTTLARANRLAQDQWN